ncbi:uncharacterized protein LOC127813238 [Diospyros lotus]|uniref:uncharacterized protein LOC127813238 n=1 Tax=Diospyros lotus TaxID=55363 RepID=UPI002258E83B|nr:uncharacterized protein LOC127813238 [Diospyros lotus]
MRELGLEDQSRHSGARDLSPDSGIFTVESSVSLFSSASASVDRCSFASDVHDSDSLVSEVSQVTLNKVLLVGTKTSTYIGQPVVPNAAVHAVVEEQGTIKAESRQEGDSREPPKETSNRGLDPLAKRAEGRSIIGVRGSARQKTIRVF